MPEVGGQISDFRFESPPAGACAGLYLFGCPHKWFD